MINIEQRNNNIALPIPNADRWRLTEALCRLLADDDNAAALMLQIADASTKGERATYALMKLDMLAGTSSAAIELSYVEGRILADDLDYITPNTKESHA